MATTSTANGQDKRPKRASGEGTKPRIDPKTGLWFASIMVGYKPNGKPDRRRVKAKTQAACLAKLQTLKVDESPGSSRRPERGARLSRPTSSAGCRRSRAHGATPRSTATG